MGPDCCGLETFRSLQFLYYTNRRTLKRSLLRSNNANYYAKRNNKEWGLEVFGGKIEDGGPVTTCKIVFSVKEEQ